MLVAALAGRPYGAPAALRVRLRLGERVQR
jgi:hypothetical protein